MPRPEKGSKEAKEWAAKMKSAREAKKSMKGGEVMTTVKDVAKKSKGAISNILGKIKDEVKRDIKEISKAGKKIAKGGTLKKSSSSTPSTPPPQENQMAKFIREHQRLQSQIDNEIPNAMRYDGYIAQKFKKIQDDKKSADVERSLERIDESLLDEMLDEFEEQYLTPGVMKKLEKHFGGKGLKKMEGRGLEDVPDNIFNNILEQFGVRIRNGEYDLTTLDHFPELARLSSALAVSSNPLSQERRRLLDNMLDPYRASPGRVNSSSLGVSNIPEGFRVPSPMAPRRRRSPSQLDQIPIEHFHFDFEGDEFPIQPTTAAQNFILNRIDATTRSLMYPPVFPAPSLQSIPPNTGSWGGRRPRYGARPVIPSSPSSSESSSQSPPTKKARGKGIWGGASSRPIRINRPIQPPQYVSPPFTTIQQQQQIAEDALAPLAEMLRYIGRFLGVLNYGGNSFDEFVERVNNLSNNTEFQYIDELARTLQEQLQNAYNQFPNANMEDITTHAQAITAEIIYDTILTDYNEFVQEINRPDLIRSTPEYQYITPVDEESMVEGSGLRKPSIKVLGRKLV